MTRRSDLPHGFGDDAFRVRDGLAAGMSRGRLDANDLGHPFHGVRAPRHLPAGVRTYRPLLRPGDRFSGVTALAILGAPLPRDAGADLHVTAGLGLTRPRSRGVVGHAADGAGAFSRLGLPVSPAIRAFAEAARVLTVPELIAVGDFLVHTPRYREPGRPWGTPDELRLACAPGARGARTARAAAALVRLGVESPQETRLRLLLQSAGLPEPACGYRVPRIGWFDLAWPERRVLGEYDGDQHRTDAAQYEKDIRRFDLASDAGWRVVRVRSWGLGAGRGDTVRRFARALERGAPE